MISHFMEEFIEGQKNGCGDYLGDNCKNVRRFSNFLRRNCKVLRQNLKVLRRFTCNFSRNRETNSEKIRVF